MADFADIGSDATEVAIADAINRQRAAAKRASETAPEPTGECRNPRCGDDTGRDEQGKYKAFCNADCRDEFERIQRRMQ